MPVDLDSDIVNKNKIFTIREAVLASLADKAGMCYNISNSKSYYVIVSSKMNELLQIKRIVLR